MLRELDYLCTNLAYAVATAPVFVTQDRKIKMTRIIISTGTSNDLLAMASVALELRVYVWQLAPVYTGTYVYAYVPSNSNARWHLQMHMHMHAPSTSW
jgi:hypothetical protein